MMLAVRHQSKSLLERDGGKLFTFACLRRHEHWRETTFGNRVSHSISSPVSTQRLNREELNMRCAVDCHAINQLSALSCVRYQIGQTCMRFAFALRACYLTIFVLVKEGAKPHNTSLDVVSETHPLSWISWQVGLGLHLQRGSFHPWFHSSTEDMCLDLSCRMLSQWGTYLGNRERHG